LLVDLGLVEQRYRAELEVLEDWASVADVAQRYGVGRQACTLGCGATRQKDSRGWSTAVRVQTHVHTRCLQPSRPECSRCSASTRAGGLCWHCAERVGEHKVPLEREVREAAPFKAPGSIDLLGDRSLVHMVAHI
jgi:hypothetical protein